jgi:hypothetical protein
MNFQGLGLTEPILDTTIEGSFCAQHQKLLVVDKANTREILQTLENSKDLLISKPAKNTKLS